MSESGWRALSPFESQVLFVDNQATGEIVIRKDLRELDGQKWSVRFTVTNSGSWQSKTIFFEIVFIDACWDADLGPVTFHSIDNTFMLYKDLMKVDFNPMKVSRDDCGGVTYQIDYISGPQTDIEGIVIGDTSFTSRLDERSWIGTHKFRIDGYNG